MVLVGVGVGAGAVALGLGVGLDPPPPHDTTMAAQASDSTNFEACIKTPRPVGSCSAKACCAAT